MALGSVPHEPVPGFAELGFTAFTTIRSAGSFSLTGHEPSGEVFGRWMAIMQALGSEVERFASAHQVHGDRVLVHDASWAGWLRDTVGADGHLSASPGTAMGVTLADCVPIFIGHPSGAAAILHSGWRGTAAGIVGRGIEAMSRLGFHAEELRVHLGPAICGRCYEVGPDVYRAVTGHEVDRPSPADLRAVIAEQAWRCGAGDVSVSPLCTRCDNDRFFSHRAGDVGRQLAVIVAR